VDHVTKCLSVFGLFFHFARGGVGFFGFDLSVPSGSVSAGRVVGIGFVEAALKPRMAFPSEAPKPGNLLGPKKSSKIAKMISQWVMLNSPK